MSFNIANFTPKEKKWVQDLGINAASDGKADDISLADLKDAQKKLAADKYQKAVEKLFGRMSEIDQSATRNFLDALEADDTGSKDASGGTSKYAYKGIAETRMIKGEGIAEKQGTVVESSGNVAVLSKYHLSITETKTQCGPAVILSSNPIGMKAKIEFAENADINADETKLKLESTPNKEKNTITLEKLNELGKVEIIGNEDNTITIVCCHNDGKKKDVIKISKDESKPTDAAAGTGTAAGTATGTTTGATGATSGASTGTAGSGATGTTTGAGTGTSGTTAGSATGAASSTSGAASSTSGSTTSTSGSTTSTSGSTSTTTSTTTTSTTTAQPAQPKVDTSDLEKELVQAKKDLQTVSRKILRIGYLKLTYNTTSGFKAMKKNKAIKKHCYAWIEENIIKKDRSRLAVLIKKNKMFSAEYNTLSDKISDYQSYANYLRYTDNAKMTLSEKEAQLAPKKEALEQKVKEIEAQIKEAKKGKAVPKKTTTTTTSATTAGTTVTSTTTGLTGKTGTTSGTEKTTGTEDIKLSTYSSFNEDPSVKQHYQNIVLETMKDAGNKEFKESRPSSEGDLNEYVNVLAVKATPGKGGTDEYGPYNELAVDYKGYEEVTPFVQDPNNTTTGGKTQSGRPTRTLQGEFNHTFREYTQGINKGKVRVIYI